jgi:hypothetical protein
MWVSKSVKTSEQQKARSVACVFYDECFVRRLASPYTGMSVISKTPIRDSGTLS